MGAGCVAGCMSINNSISSKSFDPLVQAQAQGFQSVEVGDARPGEGRIRRSPSCKDMDLFEKFGNSYPSLLAWFKSSSEKYSARNAIAYRPIDKEEKGTITDEKGKAKEWTFIHLKPTQYLTYAQYWEEVTKVGNALKKRGLSGQETRIGLYEDTRYEWMCALYAMWSQSIVGVTVYANLGDDALAYAIREAELSAIFLGVKSIKNLSKLGSLPSLKYVISFDPIPEGTKVPEGMQLLQWYDLVHENDLTEPTIPSKNDVAVIMYTSGTTGDPKGVVMSHSNLVTTVESFSRRLEAVLCGKTPDEAYVAYLPLAHILELAAESVILSQGCMVGYGNPRTLTDTSARPHGDLREFKPTIFAGVPRIFEVMKKAGEAKLPPVGSLRRTVFERAYEDRRAALANGKDTPYWNERAFGQFRELLGGRVKMIISGGAPLNGVTHEFLSIVFGASVQQGYGLTETCALATIQRYWDIQKENVGGIVSGCEVKLRDAMDYTSSATPQRGEILLRGPNITKGYYKQPEKTAEVYLPDGWFCTGDVGEWQPRDGTLKIIGRVKALAKNAHGEYIAMEALEAVYTSNALVIPNGICVVVDSQQPYIAAIMLTDEKKAMEFCAKNNIANAVWPDVLQTDVFRQKTIESLTVTAKQANRKPFEFVKQVRVYDHEWTPENGILTAAMKLKRREIDTKYADAIKEMFSAELK